MSGLRGPEFRSGLGTPRLPVRETRGERRWTVSGIRPCVRPPPGKVGQSCLHRLQARCGRCLHSCIRRRDPKGSLARAKNAAQPGQLQGARTRRPRHEREISACERINLSDDGCRSSLHVSAALHRIVRNPCQTLRTGGAHDSQQHAILTATDPLSFPTRGCSPRSSLQAEHTDARVRDRPTRVVPPLSSSRAAPEVGRISLSASFRPQRPGCPFRPAGPCSLSSDRRHELHLSLDGPQTAGGRSVVSCHRPQARTVTCRRSAQSALDGERTSDLRLSGPGGHRSWNCESGHPLRLAARSAPLALSPPTNGWEEGVSCRDFPSAGIEGRWTVPPTFEGVPRSLAPVIPDRRHAFQASLSCRQTGEEGVSCRVVRPPAMHAR